MSDEGMIKMRVVNLIWENGDGEQTVQNFSIGDEGDPDLVLKEISTPDTAIIRESPKKHRRRVEHIARDIIRFVRENERAENSPDLTPHPWEQVVRNILDCLWAVYHMKDEPEQATE